MTEYGRIHTDGSRFGGQPLIANRKAHTMILEVLAEWGIEPRSATAQQLHVATTEALCRSIKTSETLLQPTQSNIFDASDVQKHTLIVDQDYASHTVKVKSLNDVQSAQSNALREAVIEECAKALEADAKKCDCFALEERECGCGAWCEWKSITSARAVEIVLTLKGKTNGG